MELLVSKERWDLTVIAGGCDNTSGCLQEGCLTWSEGRREGSWLMVKLGVSWMEQPRDCKQCGTYWLWQGGLVPGTVPSQGTVAT
jgi:hypothetical protein